MDVNKIVDGKIHAMSRDMNILWTFDSGRELLSITKNTGKGDSEYSDITDELKMDNNLIISDEDSQIQFQIQNDGTLRYKIHESDNYQVYL